MKLLGLIGRILVIIAIPFFLMMSAIRILMIPYWYLELEYNLPGFPPDEYGFTTQQRITYGKISMDYLLNDQPLSWIANQKLADGSPMYTENELSHFLDAKNLVHAMFTAWWILLGFLVLAIIVGVSSQGLRSLAGAVSIGGWLTIGLIAAVLVFVVIGFNSFFTDFHRLFFTGNSWLFPYSATFIRLFPLQFWQDGFLWAGGISLVFGFLCGFFGSRLAHR